MPEKTNKQIPRCCNCVFVQGEPNSSSWSCTLKQQLVNDDMPACANYEKKPRREKKELAISTKGRYADEFTAVITGNSLDRYCGICTHFFCERGYQMGSCSVMQAEAMAQDKACDQFKRDKSAKRLKPVEDRPSFLSNKINY